MSAIEQIRPLKKGPEPVRTGRRSEREKLEVLARVAAFNAGMTDQRRADLALAGALYRKDAAEQSPGVTESITVRPHVAKVGTILIQSANGGEINGIEWTRQLATEMLAETPEEVL